MDAGVGVRMIMDWWISSVGVCASMMLCILQDVIKVAVHGATAGQIVADGRAQERVWVCEIEVYIIHFCN